MMEDDGGSFEKVNYLLRLKKQIERKMMIELIESFGGILPVSSYRYVGFGSVYFADFIMYHKYLNIRKMTSLEREKKKKMRFKYNLPYEFVELIMKPAGEYMDSDLNWDEKLIMWLDYDSMIDDSMIEDIKTFSQKAKHGDFLFVTVEAEPHRDEEETSQFLEAFSEHTGNVSLRKARENFPLVMSRIVSSSVHEGLRDRFDETGVKQIFNVAYADTKTMYTYGAVFFTDMGAIFEESGVDDLRFVTEGDNVYHINCPLLTPKEKYHLDARIDSQGVCKAKKKPTGLTSSQRKCYAEFYKYYPQFFESIY